MADSNLLTKSDFVYALECSTKQYYRDLYPDVHPDDDFLKHLAEGGIQVGALARAYYPNAIDLSEVRDPRVAIERTMELLARDEVVIFEAAFQYLSYFVRIDILKKSEGAIDLIEVKSKSCAGTADFTTNKGNIRAEWKELIHEVAFQTYVAANARPQDSYSPWVMLVDKSRSATVDGLLMALPVDGVSRTCRLDTDRLGPEGLGERILIELDVSAEVELVRADVDGEDAIARRARELAEARATGTRLAPVVVKLCKSCEWREPFSTPSGLETGCWSMLHGEAATDPVGSPIFEINNFRKWDEHARDGRYLIEHSAGITLNERQQLQVDIALGKRPIEYVGPDLQAELKSHQYPLYFIDFEAWPPAVPAHRGRSPYSRLAFQFSVHRMDADGSVTHHAEWLNPDPRDFPNFECVRELRQAIGDGPGSVFQYSPYENGVLNEIRRQLADGRERLDDAKELVQWIETLTSSSSEKRPPGERAMIDICKLVVAHYYHGRMHGSNSIKHVLHACLGASEKLRQVYSRPYSSRNFDRQVWWQEGEDGWPLYPYKLLESIGIEGHEARAGDDDDDEEGAVTHGGAAIAAYHRLHYLAVDQAEAATLRASLLRYCELDTLAMVMIYQHWLSLGASSLRGSESSTHDSIA